MIQCWPTSKYSLHGRAPRADHPHVCLGTAFALGPLAQRSMNDTKRGTPIGTVEFVSFACGGIQNEMPVRPSGR